MIPELCVGDRVLPGKLSSSGATYYDLSELCTTQDDKVLAFIGEDYFTIQLTAAIHGTTFVTQQQYLRYKKPVRWTTSAKVNAKGLLSFNLFISGEVRLTNASLNPEALFHLQTRGLGEAYLVLLRQLRTRVSGHHALDALAQQALNLFRGTRGFVGQRKLESRDTLYMDLAAHMYPAFAEYAAKSELVDKHSMPNRHRIAFPEPFIPYFREPSWNHLLTKLFGTRLSQEMVERLQPERAPVAVLAGAFLVRSLVPSFQLLDFEIEPYFTGHSGYPALGEVRRVLRAVKAENRERLLQELRQNPNVRFHELAKVILDATKGMQDPARKYELAGFEDVRTWEELRQHAAYVYHGQVELQLSAQQQRAEVVKQLVNDAFCSLPDPHGVEVRDGTIYAHTVHGKQIKLLAALFKQVAFAPALAKPGAFARNSALRAIASELQQEGMAYAKFRHLHLSEGEVMLRRLIAALDASLMRHKVEITKRNRTRLLVALTMFGNALKEHNSIPTNAWALIASDLELPQVYSGLILNATVTQMVDFATFPKHTQVALTGYDPSK